MFMDLTPKDIAEKIKQLRKANKLTQEQLAEKLNIDQRNLVRLESGKGFPSITTLIKIAEALNTTPNFLLSIDDNNIPKNKIKNDINAILTLAKEEQLQLIKKLVIAVL